MKKIRIKISVEVNLDPVSGWGNNPDDFVKDIQFRLDQAYPHYEPKVKFEKLVIEKQESKIWPRCKTKNCGHLAQDHDEKGKCEVCCKCQEYKEKN